jgi:hypothetical protein
MIICSHIRLLQIAVINESTDYGKQTVFSQYSMYINAFRYKVSFYLKSEFNYSGLTPRGVSEI